MVRDDVLPGTSTVWEYLMFHAELRLPRATTRAQDQPVKKAPSCESPGTTCSLQGTRYSTKKETQNEHYEAECCTTICARSELCSCFREVAIRHIFSLWTGSDGGSGSLLLVMSPHSEWLQQPTRYNRCLSMAISTLA
jgi:hypothetical protein